MSTTPRFWRNVTVIALAHIALIAGLIHWSVAARSAPDAESLVWLSGSEDLPTDRAKSPAAVPEEVSVPAAEPESTISDESEKAEPPLTQAKSDIEFPKRTSLETPIPKATPKSKATPSPTPKSKLKSAPKKPVLGKAPKSSAHSESTPPKSKAEQSKTRNDKKKNSEVVSAKTKSSFDKNGGKAGSAGEGGSIGGGRNASEFAWYGNMLHDRFYRAWIQPTANVATGTKISTLVNVRIEKDGHVSKFEIVQPSGNAVVNESVRVVAKQVTQVDPPPTALIHGDHYDIKINFELNTNQQTTK